MKANSGFANERWTEVHFDFDFTNKFRLEVSDYGRVRSCTKLGSNRLLKGSMINGYRIIRLKLFRPRDIKSETFLTYQKQQVAKINARKAQLKRKLVSKRITAETKNKIRAELAQVKQLLAGQKKHYEALYKKDALGRTINYSHLIHRLVAENFLKQPTPDHSVVIHLDFNKTNNHFANLKWVTLAESIAHQQNSPFVIEEKAARKGKRPAQSKSFKLSETHVMRIKKKIEQGVPLKTLAKQFKITQTQLLRIKRGENWGDVQPAF